MYDVSFRGTDMSLLDSEVRHGCRSRMRRRYRYGRQEFLKQQRAEACRLHKFPPAAHMRAPECRGFWRHRRWWRASGPPPTCFPAITSTSSASSALQAHPSATLPMPSSFLGTAGIGRVRKQCRLNYCSTLQSGSLSNLGSPVKQ